MPTPPLSPGKAAAIRELLEQGLSHRAISDRLGVGLGTVSNVRRADTQQSTATATAKDAPKWEKARALLAKGRCTLESLAIAAGTSDLDAAVWLSGQKAAGLNVVELNGSYTVPKAPAYGAAGEQVEIYSDSDSVFRFGCSTDQHLCSKYARVDCLHWLYDRFAAEGLEAVANCGNWIDGEARFNIHDLLVHGMDAQLDYLVEHYPSREGVTTYAVAGDDHEGWYCQKFGVDIGRHAEDRFIAAGRSDWRNIGFMEGRISLVNSQTGKASSLMLVHPGGGSAYAHSYQPQKLVESLEGGTKPAILLIGHYHKQSFNRIRNVYTVQCGTTQEQTPFMRKKRLEAHVGGAIVEARQDPETGAILSCTVELIGYFDKGYHVGNRWSYAGPVNHPVRA